MRFKQKDNLNKVLSNFCGEEMSNPFINGASSKESHFYALFESLNNSLEHEFYSDATMLIIQFAILFNGVVISKELFIKTKECLKEFVESDEQFDGSVSIEVDLGRNELLREVYENETLDFDETGYEELIADTWFYRNFGYDTYRSMKQKRVIHSLLRDNAGNTSLVSMPTGAGKSIVGLALAKFTGGLTIIIMPTVALTIDQYRNYKTLYNEGEIAAYYSTNNSQKEKEKILNSILDEKLKVLYVSPEAVMNGRFKEAIFSASKKGYLKNIIIDECHLVNTWGSFFRTDFQLLSLFVREIYAVNSSISMLLLSATINEEDISELSSLFTLNKFMEFREDALRSELVFDAELFLNEADKVEAIINQLPLLPKPMILYTRKPSDAEFLLQKIKGNNGLSKIVTFTGQTKNSERDRIIELWNNNHLDIVIATSAFGMGVDKKNVRSVIHHKIPSNLKDYYQEAGRGGRDRLKCYSKIFFSQEDYGCFNNSFLTSERFIDRWFGLIKEAEKVNYNEYETILDSVPIDMLDNKTGRLNQAWNENVILLMNKMNLIELLDIWNSDGEKKVKFRITEPLILDSHPSSIDLLCACIEEQRNLSKVSNDRFKEYFSKISSKCISEYFIKEFPDSKYTCSGCYSCKDNYLCIKVDSHRYSEESLINENIREIFGKRLVGLKVDIRNEECLVNIINKVSIYPIVLDIKLELYQSLKDKLGVCRYFYTNDVSLYDKSFLANNIILKVVENDQLDYYKYLNNFIEGQNILFVFNDETQAMYKDLEDAVDMSVNYYYFNERFSI